MSAADALQNGFIKVFRYLGKFKGDADLFFWIRKIIIRSAIDQYKTDNKRRVDDLDEVETSDTSYHQTIDFDLHNYNEMMGLISRLPNGYKNVFSMYVLDDMSYKEISDLLEISESTCRTQLFKARKLLQKMILTEKPEIVKEYNLIKKIG